MTKIAGSDPGSFFRFGIYYPRMELRAKPNTQEETMKKPFLTFVLTLMLTASLAACTAAPGDTGTAAGRNSGTMMDGRARTGSDNTMNNAGRYSANDKGEVYGNNDGIGKDMRRAADDMMRGMYNAVNDMTH